LRRNRIGATGSCFMDGVSRREVVTYRRCPRPHSDVRRATPQYRSRRWMHELNEWPFDVSG